MPSIALRFNQPQCVAAHIFNARWETDGHSSIYHFDTRKTVHRASEWAKR